MTKIKKILFIQFSFFLYSLASFFSKCAGNSETVFYFLLFYSCSFIFLGIYAILWQKILSKNSLIFAYLNKGITLIWGLFFGYFIFHETIKWNMILGICFVIIGIIFINVEGDKEL